MSNKRLGRGLDALIPSLNADEGDHVTELEISNIRPNPYQPRKHFNEEQLDELKTSIKEHGVIQPIVVRKSIKGYEIVAGERRWRATKAIGLEKIPVVVKEFSDQQVMEIALIENLQREDLNPVEVAYAYDKLMKQFDLTQEELAAKVGKSRPNVANFLRLLHLPKDILDEMSNNQLSMGHARALIALENREVQIQFAKKVIEESWSVRTLEDKIKAYKNKNVSRETKQNVVKREDKMILDVEERLRDRFKTAVKIKSGKKKGKIEIEYFNESDLQRLLEMFGIR